MIVNTHYTGFVHAELLYSNNLCAVKPESDWSTLPLVDFVLINHHVALAGYSV